jgi:hypothetical protein
LEFWTSRPVREVLRSHVNYVVADTKVWEQSAAYFIDTHPSVESFVKNAGLGLAIPYQHNGARSRRARDEGLRRWRYALVQKPEEVRRVLDHA